MFAKLPSEQELRYDVVAGNSPVTILLPHIRIFGYLRERALKNFATGRRNWLFAKSIHEAQANAAVYSITETAMLNGQKPYNYLTYVMGKMKNLGPFPEKETTLELLTWSASLPADC